ncbi:hypothetical protein GCM10010344_00010 [Streptomyces bluensis]|nr:hypothetical protein GCM10010344_00010 [Streptomyces bluensis]
MVEQVGQRRREDRDVVREAGQQPGARPQGADPVLDTGGSGAVQDEQDARERVAPSPLLHRRFLESRAAPRHHGHVAVEAFVRGELGGEAFGAHGGPVDLDERPQHRPVVAVGGAAPVVQEGVGDDGFAAPDRVVDLGIQSSGRHRSDTVLEGRRPRSSGHSEASCMSYGVGNHTRDRPA